MENKDYLKDIENNDTEHMDAGGEKEDVTDLQTGGSKTEQEKESEEEYERFCFLCHRPESQTGKLITLGQGISICPECMQRTMDTIQNGNIDFSKLQ